MRYLLLGGNAAINGSGLSALQGCKLDLLTLNRTGLDDAGLLQAAFIPKLSHIQIDHTSITYEGLLAIAGNSRFLMKRAGAGWMIGAVQERLDGWQHSVLQGGFWAGLLAEHCLPAGSFTLMQLSLQTAAPKSAALLQWMPF